MPLRHSSPAHPRATVKATSASHGSPAAAVRSTTPSAPCTVTPRRAILRTRLSTPPSATTRFEPPPRTRRSRPRRSAQATASTTLRSSRASRKYRAGPPTPIVQKGANGTCGRGFTLRARRERAARVGRPAGDTRPDDSVGIVLVLGIVDGYPMAHDGEREREDQHRRHDEEHH